MYHKQMKWILTYVEADDWSAVAICTQTHDACNQDNNNTKFISAHHAYVMRWFKCLFFIKHILIHKILLGISVRLVEAIHRGR